VPLESWAKVRARMQTFDRSREGSLPMTGETSRGDLRFVIYARTDGRFIVIDATRPWDAACVHVGTQTECVEVAERLAALVGAPPVDSVEAERRAHREGRADPLQTRAEQILGLDETLE
jgi:hypothetical protein